MARPAPTPAAEPATGAAATARRGPSPARADDEAPRTIRRPATAAKPAAVPKAPKAAPGEEKRRGRLTLTNALSGDDERTRSVAAFRRRMQRLTGHRQTEQKEKLAREVTIPETITIQELANRMAERAVDVIKLLMKQGEMHKITDVIDADTAQLIAEELGHSVKRVAESDVEEGLFDEPGRRRPPRAAPAGRDHHGPCRPRQDLAPRRDPQDQRRLGRGRRHHAAYRRLPGDLAARRQDHLHRHARPRGLHGHARPRRQGDGHRRAGGGGR